MGCCISSTTTPKGSSHQMPPKYHHRSPPKPQPNKPRDTMSTPPLEEERVKEVLSETPIIPKPQKTCPVTTTLTQQEHNRIQEPKTQPERNFSNNTKHEENHEHERTPEISQASEVCSNVTDTLSTATATTTTTTTTITIAEIRDDEATSKKRVNRSPAKVPRKRPYTGDSVSRSPVVKRELPGQVRTTAGHRNVASSGVRREFGRSPATRTVGGGGRGRVGANQVKVTGKTGGRLVGRNRKGEMNDGVLRRQQQQLAGNESLENPLVSMECFIFL